MFAAKVVVAVLVAACVVVCVDAMPGVVRERHIIHTPIKFKTIHHYKIQKIPIVIKKHVYLYKHEEDGKEDDSTNLIHHDFDDHNSNHLNIYPPYGKYNDFREINYDQNDYDDPKKLDEEDYEDYEYE